MLRSRPKGWWVTAYLMVALACTSAWLLFDQRLAGQTGLHRQVWAVNDFHGRPVIDDISPDASLDFLEDDPRLPRRNFSARWQGYWYAPSSQFVTMHVGADDAADIWIDGELRFARSIAETQVFELEAGVHELQVRFQQYGGAAHLSLLAGRAGAYPRPLGIEYLFPDPPGPEHLARLTATIWLKNASGLIWAIGALAGALVVLGRRGRNPTVADGTVRSIPAVFPTGYDVAALTALCLALLVYGYGNLSLRQSATDSLENLTLGVRLAQEGVFQRWPGQVGDHRREPLGPSFVALADLGAKALGQGSVPSECISNESVFRRDYCRQAYAPYRVMHLVLLLVGALGVFWLVLRLTAVRVLAYLGFLLTAQSAALLDSADTFLTEVHAAALIVVVAALSWLTATTRRPLYAALLGLALAGLALTKVIFVYLWIPIALTFVAADWLRRRVDWTTAGLVGILFVAQAIPVGGWMTRNYLLSGNFAVSEARSASVFGWRESFNTMRSDEWAAGFAYYLPLTRERLHSGGAAEESYERFQDGSDLAFGESANRRYTRRRTELWTDDNPALLGLDELGQRRWVNDTMADESVARLLAEPVQHLRVSLLFAWRGVFAEEGLGFLSDPLNRRLADVTGRINWPRWRHAYGPASATIVNLIGFFALIVVPLWLWLGRGQLETILCFLPALYTHGAHAMVYMAPRYAEPQIPLRVIATMVLLYLVWSSLRAGPDRRVAPDDSRPRPDQ